MDHHHHQNNCKVSNTEFADVDFDDPIFSTPILSSLNLPQRNTTASATVALADADCPQPQLHVPLPPKVQQKLNTICEEKEQPQPDAELRRKLGLLGEEKALELLGEIYNTKTKIRTLSGYIGFMLRQEKYQCAPHSPSPSPSLSPSKSAPAASCLLHSPSSASSITPGRQGNTSGGQRELYSCLSTTPSKSARTSLFQVPSSAPHNTSAHQGEALTNRSADQPGHDGRAQLEALGELEFRKQFLILNYAGGEKLENVIAPETIRSWKGMPMQQFENTVWDVLDSKYTRKEDRQWTLDWDSRQAYVYHCEVAVDGSYKFKGPYQHTTKRTLLQKILGDDSTLMVKFADAVNDKDPGKKMGLYVNYSKVAREGILVGLRRYCFFVFKDGGNKEKKKNPTSSPVKCYFVRLGSNATIDRGGDYIISNRTAHKARCIFMHPHTVSSVSNYMIRFSLILSKTESLNKNLLEPTSKAHLLGFNLIRYLFRMVKVSDRLVMCWSACLLLTNISST
ncbi:probable RNA-dependent RNA polymerase 3 isoform X2 [Malus sylvestris]|uniref:probable RNA-dependent RNA polymerase 3 isoform X2 n=1 Tax=Malus sylvestris TaxID=3752 RepID=UPI0021AD25D4|nr:probable RNA-dependent RNA polymerase 3 isoform X2 [Malus sylvestris]